MAMRVLDLLSAGVVMLVTMVSGEFFTSLVGLEKLLKDDASLLSHLDPYIKAEENRLSAIQRVVREKSTLALLGKLGDEEAENPVTGYRLLKNSVTFTVTALRLVREVTDFNKFGWSGRESSAGEADLDGAASALFRLQDTYAVSAEELADGRVPGAAPNASKLTADDCFHLGYSAAQAYDFYHAIHWLTLAESRVEKEDAVSSGEEVEGRSFNSSLLYDYLAYSAYEQGNPEWAAYYGRKLRDIDPTYPAVDNLKVYEEALTNQSSKWDGKRENLPPIANARDTKDAYLEYEALCRGHNLKSTDRLFCFYRRDSPFTLLAPFKVELLHAKPHIFLFHEVLSDAEVQHLQDLAAPKLKRAMVVKEEEEEGGEAKQPRLSGDYSPEDPEAEDGEGNIIASYRIAQNMWVEDEEDKVVDAISLRVEAMTRLDVESAENLQIANYGIGGHYEPHYDMTTEDMGPDYNEEHGNRIATVLFYFNTPDAGGATVFEELGLAVRPVAKSAAFWLNLEKTGAPDLRTRHAACPVAHGLKWVANKWLHEFGQELRRPCSLKSSAIWDSIPIRPWRTNDNPIQ